MSSEPDKDGPAPASNTSDTLRLDPTEEQMRRALGLVGKTLAGPGQFAPTAGRATAMPPPERHKRRFVAEGEVPVTVLRRDHAAADAAPLRPAAGAAANRIEAAETALRDERTARERAERSLTEAQAVIRDLQTKLAHAEMARNEAVESAKSVSAAAAAARAEVSADLNELGAARAAAQSAEQRLEAERAARGKAERALRQALASRDRGEPRTMRQAPSERASVAKQPRRQVKAGGAQAGKKKVGRPRTRAIETPEPQPVRWWIKSRTAKRR